MKIFGLLVGLVCLFTVSFPSEAHSSVSNGVSPLVSFSSCPPGYSPARPQEPIYAPDPLDPGDGSGGYSDCYLTYVEKLNAAYAAYLAHLANCGEGSPGCYKEPCASVFETLYLIECTEIRENYIDCVKNLYQN